MRLDQPRASGARNHVGPGPLYAEGVMGESKNLWGKSRRPVEVRYARLARRQAMIRRTSFASLFFVLALIASTSHAEGTGEPGDIGIEHPHLVAKAAKGYRDIAGTG